MYQQKRLSPLNVSDPPLTPNVFAPIKNVIGPPNTVAALEDSMDRDWSEKSCQSVFFV